MKCRPRDGSMHFIAPGDWKRQKAYVTSAPIPGPPAFPSANDGARGDLDMVLKSARRGKISPFIVMEVMEAANARALAAAGAARLLDPHTLDSAQLVLALRELGDRAGELTRMSEAASKLACPDAAERIIEESASLFETSGS